MTFVTIFMFRSFGMTLLHMSIVLTIPTIHSLLTVSLVPKRRALMYHTPIIVLNPTSIITTNITFSIKTVSTSLNEIEEVLGASNQSVRPAMSQMVMLFKRDVR